MARRHAKDASESEPRLSRERTAHLLKRLRSLKQQVRMLKAQIAEAADENERAAERRRRY
ncbi:MAG TPA: hypothetical protein VNI78_02330 [Vicinamibacterales bacterium]|nr:hypothetical protein [Vicinamibacterales bacterium]